MYIMENVRFVEGVYETASPQDKKSTNPKPPSSFGWIAGELKLSQDELVHLFKDKAGLALNDGSIFGPGEKAICV